MIRLSVIRGSHRRIRPGCRRPAEVDSFVLDGDLRLLESRIDALLQEFDPSSTSRQSFLGAQFDLGLAWVHFAEGCGGLGLKASLQPVINAADELR